MSLMIFFLCQILSTSFSCLGQPTSDSTVDIRFKGKSVQLERTAKQILDSLCAVAGQNPELGFVVTAYFQDMCIKCGPRAWDRTNRIVSYLIRKGVSAIRIRSTSELDSINKVMVSMERWQPFSPDEHPKLRSRKK